MLKVENLQKLNENLKTDNDKLKEENIALTNQLSKIKALMIKHEYERIQLEQE